MEIPVGRRRFLRRSALRLPLDPPGARLARRFLRVEPWLTFARLAALLAVTTVDFVVRPAPPLPIWIGVWLVVVVSSIPRVNGILPRQSPYRTVAGELRIPGVPVEVAKQWVEQNPGVRPTTEPDPRPRSRHWYATWSAVLLISAIGLFTVSATNGREDSLLIWVAVPSLFLAGIASAFKMLPRGRLRIEDGDS
ncbi:hypothetical protein [Paractinoplanes durhamensis]|uniref:hypothetical protein n=1 Tax=Paractinoplanes durhamensis TaxID=113563 RepID=UPI0036447FF7